MTAILILLVIVFTATIAPVIFAYRAREAKKQEVFANALVTALAVDLTAIFTFSLFGLV
ncbi:hypothetical protein [Stutzerimonas kunmingensis]|uniref:Uncharacterized protein n=1 Tax=Stutzerimonas kunmingensis TaxID=1211807 RepID=A0A9X1N4M2_9GAMM|nr:hypothetical protein [Stutzerimonas kunmingensis]MCD1608609.1 hypothetical protein [Stutzerimonas kunmingensis]